VICFVIDVGGNERDPYDDYFNLRRELELYNPNLLRRSSVIVANKMDIKGAKDVLQYFQEILTKRSDHSVVIPISAKEKNNIDSLKQQLRQLVQNAVDTKVAP